jgi:CheY-like chemotaxis protein
VGPTARILLVEDDPDVRSALVELLADAGYDVCCANNGEEALAALRAAVAPSAILLDLAMPVMDGFTFRAQQQRDPALAEIPTIVISASFSDPRAVASLEADAFLAKPFEVSSLMETLSAVC